MESANEEDSSGPSSLSSDQASLCVIPDPDDSSEEDGFIYLDKSSLPESLNISEHGRTVVVFHSVDEVYPADHSILCQYIRPEGWKESSQDGISLFKVGWVAVAECIAHVAVPEPTSASDPIGCVTFPADTLPKDVWNLYQFCYMRDGVLLGASTPFQFVAPSIASGVEDTKEVLQGGLIDKKSSNKEKSVKYHAVLSWYPFADKTSTHPIMEDKASPKKDQLTQASDMECFLQSCREMSELSGFDMAVSSDMSSLYELYEELSPSGCQIHQKEDETTEASKTTLAEKDLKSTKSSLIFMQESLKSAPQDVELCNDRNSEPSHMKQTSLFARKYPLDQSSHLKKRLEEVNEEKEWFQQQYNSLLIAMKKYADDLASERSEKESLNGHIAELMISHKMMSSENTRLNDELQNLRENQLTQSQRNQRLTESTVLDNQMEKRTPLECKCEKYKKQLDDMTARLSGYEVMRNCLEVELEEEIKLGQERDRYLVQLEQIKLHDFQMANNWVASTPNAAASSNALLEMEENVNSTLEALECALKEMEVLRSRKAAVNRANRVLREEFMRRREEWETEIHNQEVEFVSKINDLKKQLECERSEKFNLEEERNTFKAELHSLYSNGNYQNQNNSLEVAEKEIQTIREQKLQVEKECTLLKDKLGKLEIYDIGQQESQYEDINSTLLKNLQEARDEYKKLYTEKTRIQEKLLKLQQKVKTKKNSRAHQETITSDTPKVDHAVDFMDNVCTTWRAIVDELM